MPKDFRIGSDIVSISRFKKILSRTPAMKRHLFLQKEMQGKSIESLAGIFAAKEAVLKALGLETRAWQEIEISYAKNRSPKIKISSRKYRCEVSISHDGDYAFAVALCLKA